MIIGSGSTLDGRYELERRLGRGGFGEVFAATHVETRRPCAIKLLAARPETADREDRLLREAHLAAALVDDHITRVLDAGIHDGIPFVVMERLEGEDLGRRLERSGAFPPGPTALFSLHVARALTAAHAHDIVHLDLKPRNMFLTWTADGRPLVKLLDFGTAKLLRHTSEESSTLLAGTPVYMAPEQFTEAEVGPPADIYAFGMSAFHMLVGRAYYDLEQQQTANPFALAARLLRGLPESAAARAARYQAVAPEAFDGWFARCTHIEPARRFPSALAAHAALMEALQLTPSALDAVDVAPLAPLSRAAAQVRGATTASLSKPEFSTAGIRRLNAPPAPTKRARNTWVRLGAVVGTAIVGTVAIIGVRSKPPPPPLVVSGLAIATTWLDEQARDPALSADTDHCRTGYRWGGVGLRVFYPRGPDDSCDTGPSRPLVVLLPDHQPSTQIDYESYHYLQRHLAHNGFVSVSLEVGAQSVPKASHTALSLMEGFLSTYWPGRRLADFDSIALAGHGRGAAAVRFLAADLHAHPRFHVRSVVTLQSSHEDLAFDARHAEAHLELTAGRPSRDAVVTETPITTWKRLAGDSAGFAGGNPEQNRVVAGYVLAFLAAHHLGRVDWHTSYISGDRIPGRARPFRP